ncbi:LAME_0F10242g1_1 [Lachancea meyersii CBS 8951]|uniref:Crossover junction endonuclease MUS81 n=1 Tax=Lachancea meyersii CBS 8951 TaxID=1266667 RepID=A0A1G4JVJ4_9SACH|nr:LAME_0F10242g1_1 [Lachancea meyersii CBS 8951]
MSLPEDLKPWYIEWLELETVKAAQKNEKLGAVYAKALENLKSHDLALVHPNQLLSVKGIGNRIKNVLRDRLHAHCKETGFELPSDPSLQVANVENRQRTKIRSLQNNDPDDERPKKKRKYVPKRRSGAYAILLALLENNSPRSGSSKNEVVALASKYCDHSFTSNPTSRDFHSAWSAIKTLLARELVYEEGRPKRYVLTQEGEEMAHSLKRTDQVEFEDEAAYQTRLSTQKEGSPREIANEISDASVNYSALMEATASPDPNVPVIPRQDNFEHQFGNDLAYMTHSLTGSVSAAHTTGQYSKSGSASPSRVRDNIVRARWNGISYELWDPGTYDIVLIIDHREVKSRKDREFFSTQLQDKGVSVDTRQLSLSDMLWVARNKSTKRECVLNFILERKRLDDFAMSIMDNRFLEQKNRLKKTGCKNIYYLVEDTVSDTAIRMADAIKTAVWMTVIYNGFHVKRTKNSNSTVAWLKGMTQVIESHYFKKALLVMSPRDLKNQEDYFTTLRSFQQQFERTEALECCQRFDCFQEIMDKRSLMTVKELYLRTLLTNKGVSLEKALSIQAKFPTLKSLLLAYRACDSEVSGKSLISNALKDEPGTRKIGKALSESLWCTFGKR